MNSTFDTQRFYFIRLCSLLFMYFLATNVYSQNEYCVTESYEDNLAYYSENNLLPPDALNYNFCINYHSCNRLSYNELNLIVVFFKIKICM